MVDPLKNYKVRNLTSINGLASTIVMEDSKDE